MFKYLYLCNYGNKLIKQQLYLNINWNILLNNTDIGF